MVKAPKTQLSDLKLTLMVDIDDHFPIEMAIYPPGVSHSYGSHGPFLEKNDDLRMNSGDFP